MKQRIIILLIFFLCLQGAFANVAQYQYGKGGMIYPIKSDALTMTYEKIDIDAYANEDKWDVDNGLNYCYIEYRCFYQFQNNGNTDNFLMGFPIHYGAFVYPHPELPSSNPVIADFQLKTNGKISGYTLYPQGFNPELDDTDYDEVYGFSVNIKKGDRVTIEVLYTVIQPGYVGMPINLDTITEVYYILKSGSTLKGPIQKADITVQFHFPEEIEIKDSPAKPVIRKSATSPYTVVAWKLTDFIPKSDISIGFRIDSDLEKGESIPKESIRELQEKKNLDAYFRLKMERSTDEKRFISYREELKTALIPFYKACLGDVNTPSNLTGFIIADIDKNPFLSPDAELVKKTRKNLEDKAIQYVKQDIERYKSILSAMKEDPLNWKLKRKANLLMGYNVLNLSEVDSKRGINNYFLKLLNNEYNRKEWSDLNEFLSNNKSSNIPLLNKLLAEKKDNANEIINFLDTLPIESGDLEKRLKELTLSIWDNKNHSDEAFILEKLLHVMHRINYRFSHSYAPVIIEKIFYKNRALIRKAFYSLANFYFGTKFEKSILFYKLAMVYGKISPFYDYLSCQNGMSGYRYAFVDDLYEGILDPDIDQNENDKKTREQEAFLKTIYGTQPPWWKSLVKSDGTGDYSEKAITGLYTSDRLLKLNLSAWTQEPVNDAPCYYIAYNMACAYSRMEKGKESLGWLETAFKMNKDLKKSAGEDKDLAYVREKFKADFDRLLK